jgi:anti-sigma-K factor RskA
MQHIVLCRKGKREPSALLPRNGIWLLASCPFAFSLRFVMMPIVMRGGFEMTTDGGSAHWIEGVGDGDLASTRKLFDGIALDIWNFDTGADAAVAAREVRAANFLAVCARSAEFLGQDGSLYDWVSEITPPETGIDEHGKGIGSALAAVDAQTRRAIVVAATNDITYEEIASVLRIPVGDVREWFRKGLERIADHSGLGLNSDADEVLQEADMLSAECAFGVLTDGERRALEAVLEVDPSLQDRLLIWTELAEGLAEIGTELESIWDLVFTHLVSAQEPVDQDTASDVGDELSGEPKSGLLSRIGLVPYAALGLVLALLVLTFFDLRLEPERPMADYSATLSDQENGLSIVVDYVSETGVMVVRHVSGSATEGRALELWLVMADREAPISLGVVGNRREERIVIPETLRTTLPASSVAVTEERLGGSSNGRPAGESLTTATFAPIQR